MRSLPLHALTQSRFVLVRPRQIARWLLLAPLLLTPLGCTGTDTGNPLGGGDGPGPTYPGGDGESTSSLCREVKRRELAVDEPTALGFSAQEVLASVVGEHEASLRWHPLAIADYGPEHEQQTLSIRVARTAAPIVLVDYERRTDVGEIGGECPDQLEIEVDVIAQSSGGALDEQFRTKVTADSKELARIGQRLEPAQLGGSFAVSQVHVPDIELASVTLSLSFTRFGLGGALTPSFESPPRGDQSDSSVSQAASGSLATIGLAGCESGVAVPESARVAQFSAADVHALLAAHPAAQTRWQDGSESPLTLAFAPSEEGACATLVEHNHFLEGKVGTLVIRGLLTATSDDGRIAGRWQVIATAAPSASGGPLELVSFELDYRVRRDDSSLSEGYGLHGFDVSAYDRFGVRIALSLSPAGSWAGKVEITGYDDPMCSTTPVQEPGGGVSSPGCMGATPHEVALATVSSAR